MELTNEREVIQSRRHENVYASNVKGKTIHISEAPSGRQGYFCLGCRRALQAVQSTHEDRISYFRHDAEAVRGLPKCTYSCETERHKIAKSILQIIKEIKVPAVYKYPPKSVQGLANLLQEGTTIQATKVVTEPTFYEDDAGNIKWTKEINPTQNNLLLRPDVAFFDSDNKPILFIEIIATHKVSEDKKVKLKRLGVNTIQVSIPKSTPEIIQETFYVTKFTKWIYNYEESNAEYVPVSAGNSEGILPIDELQRKLFEENYNCRTAQIKRLIRSIKRCLESESYRASEQANRLELSRVEKNAERERDHIEQLQDEIREGIDSKHEQRGKEIRIKRITFDRESKEFEMESSNLEGRYNSKNSEIEESIKQAILGLEGSGAKLENRRREIEISRKRVDYLIEKESSEIEGIESDEGTVPEQFEKDERTFKFFIVREKDEIRREERGLPIRIESEERNFVKRIQQEEGDIESKVRRLRHEEERIVTEIGAIEEEERGDFKAARINLEKKFDGIRNDIFEAVSKRDNRFNDGFTHHFKSFLEGLYYFNSIKEAQVAYERNRAAWKAFDEGTYKRWDKFKGLYGGS